MLCPLRLEIDELTSGSPALIDAALLKKHVRVDFTDDDDLLDAYAQAAVLWIEADTKRTIVRRAHRWILKDFNLSHPYDLRLPRGKTVSVESVQYSASGAVQTLTGPSSDPVGTGYQEDLRGDDGGVIMPSRGGSWPSVDSDVPAPVVINFTAGWTISNLPADLLHAILFCIADAYDLRGTQDFHPSMLGTDGARLKAREALISGYRLSRWY